MAGAIALAAGEQAGRGARPRRRWVRANWYDAASDGDQNRKHWLPSAAGLSAGQCADAALRRTLRNRARYECDNNTYAAGMVATLANDAIGVGPTLQAGLRSPTAATAVETLWWEWAEEVGLGDKLWTMRRARAVDGESFLLLVDDEDMEHPVKMTCRVLEADYVADEGFALVGGPHRVDGIEFDRSGRPAWYTVLDPSAGAGALAGAALRVHASRVRHWFRADRPGQRRGVSEIQAALPLYAMLRRYTLAVLAAAETAAEISLVTTTDAPADPDDEDETGRPEAFDEFEIARNAGMVLPSGVKVQQLKAEQPTTAYPDFKTEIISEIARGLNMPFNVAAGNSAGYNYSSGRLDHRIYYRALEIDRTSCVRSVLDPVFRAVMLAAGAAGALPASAARLAGRVPHEWHWQPPASIDDLKEANASWRRLLNGDLSLSQMCAERNLDWEEVAEQRAREAAKLRSLGLPVPWEQPEEGGEEGRRATREAAEADESEIDTELEETRV